MQDYKEIGISELNLPPRIYIHLKKENILTVDDLKNCDITAFDFSEREIKEIRYQLKQFGITLSEQPEPQPTIIQSKEHIKAVALHQKIMTSIELIDRNLWDMCTALKEMRDNKLYKEFGYQNFEDYCKNEFGMTRRNAYRYISSVENINPQFVTSMSQIGMTKLSLLATISEEQQAEIAERVDLENTTVKKLKEEIAQLKAKNDDFQTNIEISSKKISELESQNAELESKHDTLEKENNDIWAENEQLHKQVRELENRPVEVAVLEPEPSDNERLLQETIRNLQIESQKRDEELERQYREDEKAVRKMLEKQKQDALQQLTDEYERKIYMLQSNTNSGAEKDEFIKSLIQNINSILVQIFAYAKKDVSKTRYISAFDQISNLINIYKTDLNKK